MTIDPPSVSVAIATFNEGPDLEATIATVYASKYPPREVIVCDDNSEEDPAPRLASWSGRPGFTYLRNRRRMGSGATKARALSVATGDLLIVLDSHMRPHWEWLNQVVQAHVTHPNAILCAESVGFKQPSSSEFYGRGAYFDPANPYKHGAHTVSWQPPHLLEDGPYPRIPAMHGGCYVFPAYQLKVIGGYAPELQGWGYEEEWIAMRAAMLGVETRLISGCPIAHQYDRNLHRRPAEPDEVKDQGWEPIYNRHAVAIMAFGWERWAEVYRYRIDKASDAKHHAAVHTMIERRKSGIESCRAGLAAKAMPERLWMPRLGISHPGPGVPEDAPYGSPCPGAGSGTIPALPGPTRALTAPHGPIIGGGPIEIGSPRAR